MPSRLCVSSHPASAWAEVAGPWLRTHGANWREKRVVLAPNSAWIAAFKNRALEETLPILGVEWLTPGRWRTQALSSLPGPVRRIALREDLHLLLELAAHSLPENPLARAYGADPVPFQELLDALESAGWSVDVLPDPAARELARAAAKLLAQTGWLTSAAADCALHEAFAAGKLPPLGQRLLAVGFGPGDWPLSTFLQAAANAYEDVQFMFDVAENAVELSQSTTVWIGLWEEKMGVTADYLETPSDAPVPFASLALEFGQPANPSVRTNKTAPPLKNAPILWLAENLQAEADLVTAQALAFLRESENARVGVVVGSAGSPLAREVAARFAALGYLHHDVPGHLPGREKAQQLFEAWLDWQQDGRLAGLVAWLQAAERWELLDKKNTEAIEKPLREAAQALLADDPAVMSAWLATEPASADEARAFLVEWPLLPEFAPLSDFLEKSMEVAEKLHRPESAEVLAQRARDWQGKLTAPMPRTAFLNWVRAVTRVPGRTRAALGREPWARLQIVDAASAAAQTWTHLVLGGLLHGEWPSNDRDSPLFDEAQAQVLNRQVIHQGRHGEGHWTMVPGHSLLLTSTDHRRCDRANFIRLLARPSHGLAFSARLADPADGRRARLSEYFWAVARATLGRLPTEDDWAALAKSSRERREIFASALKENSAKSLQAEIRSVPGPEQTERAFQVRRDPQKPFDEFSFSLRTPPAKPLRLSCKAWEEALPRPGASWFKYLLRSKSKWQPAQEDTTRMSLGLWAHDWVRPGPANSSESYPLPQLETWRKFSAAAAQSARDRAAATFASAGRQLPESWLDASAGALRFVEHWITSLAGQVSWSHALAETTLPPGLCCTLPGVREFIPITGRMDLVLFPQGVKLNGGKFGGENAWLFDFKTGSDDDLSLKQLAKGEGLQLALYARALLVMGAGAVSLTLLNVETEPEPQLFNRDLDSPELANLWKLLADFTVRGVWGENCDLEDEHAHAGEYPSATLPVPVEILRRKWQLTHPEPA